MSTSVPNDYDRVAYPSMAHVQTFPEGLAIKGYLRGLEVAPPDRCRVLELGCGDGFNLVAMAFTHPGATYTGIDYSAEAIARGRRILGELGLWQIRLETADICQLEGLDPALGEFDYIMAHGVYSWVPAPVREALLATIGRLLAPHGVAFVSYLALPGAYLRELVRTIIRFHTQSTTDPVEKARQSRALLRLIGQGTTDTDLYTRLISAESAGIDEHTDEALFHDELSEESAPLLFTDFIAHAGRHRLQYLAEAEYLLPVSRALSDSARESLRPLDQSRVLLEQYLDFIEGRRFRQTLLCRPGLGAELKLERLDQLWVLCRATPTAIPASIIEEAPIELDRKSVV
jgi:SAM-dependent methyltransferase